VAGAAGQKWGVQEWARFVEAVALWLGGVLWQGQVEFHFHGGFWGAWVAGKGSCHTGWQVGDCHGQAINRLGQAIDHLKNWIKHIVDPVGCWFPDQQWLMVVGMLVVSDSWQFGVPGGAKVSTKVGVKVGVKVGAKVSASWIYCVCIFMVGAGRVCCTVWYFKRVIGCRVSTGFVHVWRRRGVVEGAAVVGNSVGEGHCAYAGLERSKVDAQWRWCEGHW